MDEQTPTQGVDAPVQMVDPAEQKMYELTLAAPGMLSQGSPSDRVAALGVKPLPSNYMGGPAILRAGTNAMFGYGDSYRAGDPITVEYASTRIKQKLDADTKVRGTAGDPDSEMNALAQVRAYYESQIKPLDEARKLMLESMMAPLPQRRKAGPGDVDQYEAAMAAGIALRRLIDGDNPLEPLAALAQSAQAKLDEQFAADTRMDALRREVLGVQYKEAGDEMSDLRRAMTSEVSGIRSEERALRLKQIQADMERDQRKALWKRQMIQNPDAMTRANMAEGYEQEFGEPLDPEFVKKLGVKRPADVLKDLAVEKTKAEYDQFIRMKDVVYDSATVGLEKQRLGTSELWLRLQYLPEQLRVGILQQHAALANIKGIMAQRKIDSDLRGWKTLEDVRQGWARLSQTERANVAIAARAAQTEYQINSAEIIGLLDTKRQLQLQAQSSPAMAEAVKDQVAAVEARIAELQALTKTAPSAGGVPDEILRQMAMTAPPDSVAPPGKAP